MRVVLDTNNVLSALLFPDGRLTWMRTRWTSGRINPLCSQKTATELVRVLAYPKFQLDENEIREVLDSYLLYVDVVDVPDDFGARLPSCRDAQDQVFLELAESGDAEVLVTGDRDLLTLAGQVDFAIECPRQFKTRFEERTSQLLSMSHITTAL